MSKSVYVHAPCRLHFGLFSFGHGDRPQFGGVGAMIDPPAVDVTISPATKFTARSTHQKRVEEFVDLMVANWTLGRRPNCQVTVEAPRDHTGLGVGTQLGLSVAAGLRHFLGFPPMDSADLALAVGRGTRSLVGTFGFQCGALIIDYGRPPDSCWGMMLREELPNAWRFVLICPRERQGLAGQPEADAFASLPPVPIATTERLIEIANNEIGSAVAWKNCSDFGEALYRYGRLAGECFAPVQGGPYASPEIEQRVELIRSWGIPGVGQSSWGPTVYAVVANDDGATRLASQLREHPSTADCEIIIARPSNTGATIEER
jgi:beta-RFAP synthase